MKKTKLVALLLAVSMALTACGNDGGTQKAGVFASTKIADRVAVGLSVYASDEAYVKEMANLVNQMDYTKVDYSDVPDVEDFDFVVQFIIDVDDVLDAADKTIAFINDEYCSADADSGDEYYEITCTDDTVYKRLRQLAIGVKGQDLGDYEKQIKAGEKTDVTESGNDKVQLDTENSNYKEWAKGICSNIASVPDIGKVILYMNNYKEHSCGYRIDNVTEDDFNRLVEKYESEGFNKDVIKVDDGFFAYSESSTYDYISIRRVNRSIEITLGGDIDLAGTVTARWEDSSRAEYLPKPEFGDCYLTRDQIGYYLPYPAIVSDAVSEYVVYNADKKDAEEYIEICKQNGYTVSDSDDYYDESGEIYWTGYSVDGKKYVEIICETGTNYLTICLGEE